MTEHEPDHDPYWQAHVRLGESHLHGERTGIWLRLHHETERFRSGEELIPLQFKNAQRLYVHAQPYILVPEIFLTVDIDPRATGPGPVGEVVESNWEGMSQRQIGNAQAWQYPDDRLLMLWECFLNPHYRQRDPLQDPTLKLVWTGFERVLLERFPTTERLATPAWEDLYQRDVWQEFLRQQDYQPFERAAFAKEVTKG